VTWGWVTTVLPSVAALAGIGTGLLLLRSLAAFSRTGPRVRDEILRRYSGYAALALLRLGFASFLILFWLGTLGVIPYVAWRLGYGGQPRWAEATVAAGAAMVAWTVLQFAHQLLHIPSGLVMSSHYRMARFHGLWRRLSVTRLRWARLALVAATGVPLVSGIGALVEAGHGAAALALAAAAAALLAPLLYATLPLPVRPNRSRARAGAPPNLLLVGCDTLRADRLGVLGNRRGLTPFIDALARRATVLGNCFTPVARTAPSLVSLLTGTWPLRNGVRCNFMRGGPLPVPSLPGLLAERGYRTVAVSDWSGADLGKFDLGFTDREMPDDQWNVKYLIRQGPKDIRLFLSLFAHNRLGRKLLPEIFYLAGVPLTYHLGERTRAWISRLAASGEPFCLNVFMGTAHPPFGSEWPYYLYFSDAAYAGDSKFAMARVSDPFEIIRRQQEPKEAFELDQILDLYDACVRRFDDELRAIVQHLEACGLAQNTILVVYSDHGMEFFEHNTWGQGNSVRGDASNRVPVVIADPRYPGGKVFSEVVRVVDVAPTLLDLLGVPVPQAMEGASLAGCVARGEAPPPLTAYAETGVWLTMPPGLPEGHLTYPDVLEILDVPDLADGTLEVRRQHWPAINRARDRMVRSSDWKLLYQPLEGGADLRLIPIREASDPSGAGIRDEDRLRADLLIDLGARTQPDELLPPLPDPGRGTATAVALPPTGSDRGLA